MSKPTRVTVVPARSEWKQVKPTTDHSSTKTFLIAGFGFIDLPATTKYMFLDTGEGSPDSMMEQLMKQAAKSRATAAYRKRVKQRARKPKPVISNSYKHIVAGGKFEGLVNGEPEVFSVPNAATSRTRRATSKMSDFEELAKRTTFFTLPK
jgi:hypothetical protein